MVTTDIGNAEFTNDKEPLFKVFISYSRADSAFADELVAGLQYDGRYDVTIDRDSIIEGEDWKERLGGLIADADTIVFVVSPASAASEVCTWEVEEARRLSKRILPVLAKSIGPMLAAKELAALNYVRFDSLEDGRPRSFMKGLSSLVRALNTDVSWVREHTRYLNLARSWAEVGRQTNRLLSGSDIVTAKDWLARHPKDAPPPTELHVEFIRASEQAEAQRESAERSRLAEIEQAQKARAEALQKAELATAEKMAASLKLSQRTNIGIAVAFALVVLAIVIATYAWLQHSEASRMAEFASKETARADEFVNLVSSNPSGARVMNKACEAAVDITYTLAVMPELDEKQYDRLSEPFWDLFFGPMYIVALYERQKSGRHESTIERAMNEYAGTLAALKGTPRRHSDLCVPAVNVRNACNNFLNQNFRKSCLG